MTRKDFRFWITFIILIGLSCEAAFYYKHHMIVKTHLEVAKEQAEKRAADLAAGPITSKKFARQDFPITLSTLGEISTNDTDKTYSDISFSLPEESMDNIDDGQEITFIVDDLPGVFFKGEVYAMDSEANPNTHEFDVKAMASNPDNKLQPGMNAQVQIVTDIHQNAMVLPDSAIITKDNNSFVYSVENGKAVLVPVKLGVHQEDDVEVIEGVLDGKDIIVSGTDHIEDGAPVTLENPAPAPIPAPAAPEKEDRQAD